jgi:co-chaperonin GroES (HSP10)
MSLMDCSIRSKPKAESVQDILRRIADYERITWEEYAEVFFTQRQVMEKEIGCSMPIKGHRIFLKAIVLPEKTVGGIFFTENHRDANTGYNVGMVVGLGPECFTDIERFPNGPRCKIGEWIGFTRFEKQDEEYNGHKCYIINDDRVNFPIPDIKAAVKELRPYAVAEV